MFVADASTVLCWVIPGTMTPAAQRAFDISARSLMVVPSLWLWETHNVILKLIRQRKLAPEDGQDACIAIGMLGKRVDAEFSQAVVDRVWEIASMQMMTVYDATYVELAMRLNVPIASDDTAIQNAAKHLRLKLI